MSDNCGIINLIKPPGMTSFDVVSFVRRVLRIKKAGHTGTLDPAAAGVLPVCLGRATKIIPYIPEEEKEYIGELTLGLVTDTLDAEGTILKKNDDWKGFSKEEIREAFSFFRGEIEQIPPMYSALHHKGKRLYELAREGKKVEREPRRVEIKEINILGIELPRIRFQVTCSRGTYIRSLVSDIGTRLGCGAHLSFLIRTGSGPFKIAEGVTLEELKKEGEGVLLPLDYPLDYPKLKVKDRAKKKALNGAYLNQNDLLPWPDSISPGDRVLIYDTRGSFISVDEVNYLTDKIIKCKPLRVFN